MTNNHNMIFDLETGVCGAVGEDEMEVIDFNPTKKTIEPLLCDRPHLLSLLGT